MKKYLITLLILASLSISAQEWAPIGATWHHSRYGFFAESAFEKYVVEKDTLFQGENCKKIIKEEMMGCYGRPEIEYTFERNDSIFFWDEISNKFILLYDFGLQENDTLILHFNFLGGDKDTTTVIVDSVEIIDINGNSLKCFYTTNTNHVWTYNAEIIENIGDVFHVFNAYSRAQFAICDGDYTMGLRCYEDSNIGFYQVEGQDSCEHYVPYVSIENDVSDNVEIYPNPAQNELKIISENVLYSEYRVIDNLGRIQFSGELKKSNQSINTSSLQKGIYFIQLENKNTTSILKFIKN